MPLSQWRGVLACGGWAALGSVALTIVQIVVFAIWPPVHTVGEVFDLMAMSPVLGLVSLDIIYLLNNVLVWLFYLGLGVALWPASRSTVALVVGLGTLQMAAYFASNPAVEMLALATAHADADLQGQAVLQAAGEAVLAGWKGTAFLTYYYLGAVVLLICARVLRRSHVFRPSTAGWALGAGVLMLIPSTFGTLGLVFSILSLLPWTVLCVLAGRRLLTLADDRVLESGSATSD